MRIAGDADGLTALGRQFGAGAASIEAAVQGVGRAVGGLGGSSPPGGWSSPGSWSGTSAARFHESWLAVAGRAEALAFLCGRAGTVVGAFGAEVALAQAAASAAEVATAEVATADLAAARGGGLPAMAAAVSEPDRQAAVRAGLAAEHAVEDARRRCAHDLDALLCQAPAARGDPHGGLPVGVGLQVAARMRAVATLPLGYAELAAARASRLRDEASALSRQWRFGTTPELRGTAAGALRPAARAARFAEETAAGARLTADGFAAARVAGPLARPVESVLPRLAGTPLGRLPVLGTGLTAAGVAVDIGHGEAPVRALSSTVASMAAGEVTFTLVGGALLGVGAVGAAPVVITGVASAAVAYGVGCGVGYVVDHGPGAARAVARGGRKLWHRVFG